MNDSFDNPSSYPSNYDLMRIGDMSIGDTVEAESGKWKVMRYAKEYTLCFNDRKGTMLNFKNVGGLVSYLKELA